MEIYFSDLIPTTQDRVLAQFYVRNPDFDIETLEDIPLFTLNEDVADLYGEGEST